MSSLDSLGGSALGGTLYGIGVGPGDARYLTLRAAALVKAASRTPTPMPAARMTPMPGKRPAGTPAPAATGKGHLNHH